MMALSIRQPWAWLILNAGKDVENRDWRAPRRVIGQRILIHASKSMTRDEYQDGYDTAFMIDSGIELPAFERLERGGIVGSAFLVDCVQNSNSPWFFGGHGFLLRDPAIVPFRPFKGALGFFQVPDMSDSDDGGNAR